MNAELNLALARKLWPGRKLFNQAPVTQEADWWWCLDNKRVESIPDFGSYQGMGLVIERMQERGQRIVIQPFVPSANAAYSVGFGCATPVTCSEAGLREAVALAACEAMGVEVSDG